MALGHTRDGIRFTAAAGAADGNSIAANGVLGNSISNNGGLGIDLGEDGVTDSGEILPASGQG